MEHLLHRLYGVDAPVYCVTDELKCHNLCSKYLPFSLTQVWICMRHPRHSVAVTLSRVTGDRT